MREQEIRERMDTGARALRSKAIDALMTHYAADTTTFDLMPPMQLHSAAAYRKNFERWFESVDGPIAYELRDLQVTVSDDVAFCHYLGHVKSRRTTGDKLDYWVRVTCGLRKTNGAWVITHEHVSMPIDLQTMQVARDSQP